MVTALSVTSVMVHPCVFCIVVMVVSVVGWLGLGSIYRCWAESIGLLVSVRTPLTGSGSTVSNCFGNWRGGGSSSISILSQSRSHPPGY